MLRDRTGHSSTSTLLDHGVQLGDIQVDSHAGSGRVRVGRPGFLCLTPSNAASAAAVNPAGCHPVQLATQAASTRRPALLISFSIFIVICTGSCTRYVHKGNKSAKTAFTSQSHIVLLVFFFNCVFSLCILWNFASRMRGVWGTEMPTFTTSGPDSRMKN